MKKKMLYFMLSVILPTLLYANTPTPAPRGALLVGTVIDSMLSVPVEYANVVLYDAQSNEQVTGTVTNSEGRFELTRLKPGDYNISVKFIGYYEKVVPNIRIPDRSASVDLGNIFLKQAIIMLEGVEATAERMPIEYKIDKKVINVAKQYTGASGSAVDVLENVPAVTVDIEGNVSLRGSSSFQLLIDGRPSILDANDALKQIPASSIQDIEIITNPSAKYDPDGASGIINIVSKKNALNGVNGMITLNAGVNDKYGSDVLLNFRNSKVNYYIGGDYNRRYSPGSGLTKSRTFLGDTTLFVESNGDRAFDFTGYSIRTGFDWNMSTRDKFGLGVRYGVRSFSMGGETMYAEWLEPSIGDIYRYRAFGDMSRGGGDGNVTLNYTHDFPKKGHQLVFDADFRFREGDDDTKDELYDAVGNLQSGRISNEDGPGRVLRAKLDYTLPLRENEKIEAGLQSRLSASTDRTDLSEYDPQLGQYLLLPQFNNTTEYRRNIHSLYGLYANEFGALGVQGGLRAELTDRTVELVDTNDSFTIDRLDLFPTLHMSYKFSRAQQMMMSYTRRIERPRGYYFEPFITWMDAYNVRRGNPDIKPEYIDSYEAGTQHFFGRNMISVEAYYRITNNKIERVQSVYEDNIILHSVDNVGKDYSLGLETMFNLELFPWWNLNLMGNVYKYRIDGVLYNRSFSRESNDWSVRSNNTFKFWNDTRLQFNLMYNSPSVSAQGRREGFFVTSAAVRKSFMNKKLEVILQVRDLFATGKFEFTAEGPDFYRYNKFTREAPQYTVTLNYFINNYKPERRQNFDSSGGETEGIEF